MNEIRLDSRSVQDTLRAFDKYDKLTQRRIGDQVEKSAIIIEHKAKGRAPVNKRTGVGARLRTSIERRVNKSRLSASVGTNVHYAPYVEFGTGTLVKVPSDLREYAIQFKGAGIRQVNRRAIPYLFNSVAEERDNYNEGIKKALNKVR